MQEMTPILESISDHRVTNEGAVQFLVQWSNCPMSLESWVGIEDLLLRRDYTFMDYFAAKDITSIPVKTLGNLSPLPLS